MNPSSRGFLYQQPPGTDESADGRGESRGGAESRRRESETAPEERDQRGISTAPNSFGVLAASGDD